MTPVHRLPTSRRGFVVPTVTEIPPPRDDFADFAASARPLRSPASERRTPLLNRPLNTRRLAR